MGCANCGAGGSSPAGCGNNGTCGTGGCNRMNTYDWITAMDVADPTEFKYVEISFKNGASKDFYKKDEFTDFITGDYVVVSAENGYNVGMVSLSGELVRHQMRKKKVSTKSVSGYVIRKANERDMEKMHEARQLENKALVKSRVIARTLGLEMKLGDIEYQADQRKATFFYTADGRVDFRELVREYAREFKLKVEMRQIGARQESGRIGGIGSCGRELCCSTWLSDFQPVSTSAARYQDLAINQAKLSGQCGRLKCCLNYELDTYMEALKHFPEKANYIYTKKGKAELIKTDIFNKLMYYAYVDPKLKGPVVALTAERVEEIIRLNKQKNDPDDLLDVKELLQQEMAAKEANDFADVTGEIELPNKKRRKKRRTRNKKGRNKSNSGSNQQQKQNKGGNTTNKSENKSKPKRKSRNNRRKGKNKPGGNSNKNDNKNNTNNNQK